VSTNPEPELKITLGPTRASPVSPGGGTSHAHFVSGAPRPAPRSRAKLVLVIIGAIAAAVLLAAGIAIGIYFSQTTEGVGGTAVKGLPNVGSTTGASGLTEDESRLSTVYVEGHWIEEDAIVDDTANWNCSGVVVDEDGESLIVITNSHCIGLDELIKAEIGDPEIKRFALRVAMWGRQDRITVTRFAECDNSGMDVALLRVPRGNMRPGRDFVVAPISDRKSAAVGRDVVAIGAPRGLRGTETFGRISALRGQGEVVPHAVLQTDTAINPGNSGGPLFLVSNERRNLIGLNTFGLGGEGLNFAFYADEYSRQKWQWFDATPNGASAALKAIYKVNSVTVP
jgi:S1-C subfamily serine protease